MNHGGEFVSMNLIINGEQNESIDKNIQESSSWLLSALKGNRQSEKNPCRPEWPFETRLHNIPKGILWRIFSWCQRSEMNLHMFTWKIIKSGATLSKEIVYSQLHILIYLRKFLISNTI